MDALKLDRLLETLYRREGLEVILRPGAAPAIWITGAWRRFQAPATTQAEVDRIAAEISSFRDGPHVARGFTYWLFDYGTVARFRASAFGYPATSEVRIRRLYHDDAGEGPDSRGPGRG